MFKQWRLTHYNILLQVYPQGDLVSETYVFLLYVLCFRFLILFNFLEKNSQAHFVEVNRVLYLICLGFFAGRAGRGGQTTCY